MKVFMEDTVYVQDQEFPMESLHNKLTVRENLFKRKVCIENMCPSCVEHNETMEHLFLKCHFACALVFDTPLSFMMDID